MKEKNMGQRIVHHLWDPQRGPYWLPGCQAVKHFKHSSKLGKVTKSYQLKWNKETSNIIELLVDFSAFDDQHWDRIGSSPPRLVRINWPRSLRHFFVFLIKGCVKIGYTTTIPPKWIIKWFLLVGNPGNFWFINGLRCTQFSDARERNWIPYWTYWMIQVSSCWYLYKVVPPQLCLLVYNPNN